MTALDFPEGADVLLMSFSHGVENAIATRDWYQDVTTVIGGQAQFQPGHGVPLQSVWLAADLVEGSAVAATPEGFELKERPAPWGSIHPGHGNEPDYLLDDGKSLAVWLVRPTKGAWYLLAGDGAVNDLDEESNGVIVLPFDRFVPIGASPPLHPPKPLPDDLLFVIDREQLEYYGARVEDLIIGEGEG